MGHVARGIGAAILLAAVGGALAAPQIGPPVGGPKTPRDAPATLRKPEDVKKDLMAAAAKGKVTGPVLALFREYATARAREKLVPDAVPEAFWNWLGGSKELREAVVLGLYAYDHDAGVVKTLQALRSKFGDRVRTYPHLAMAFAFVYGRAGGKSIREPPVGFVNEGRGVPSMEESFEYYLKNEKQMRMSLKTTPWPMLIFVADNDAPIEEREWALQHYADLQPGAFGKVYYHVPYDYDSVGGKGKIGDRPRTLDNILQYGGVCAHRAYYASRVFKSMGVPSLYDCGEGDRGGHAWVAWVGRDRKTVDLLFSGRFDMDRYYTGLVFDPVRRKQVLDREVQLGVAAMVRSYPGCLDAAAACFTYLMFEGAERAKVTGLLEGAVQKNPYLDAPWRLMAAGSREGLIPTKQAEKTFGNMLKLLAGYPDLTFEVLERILSPRLKVEAKPPDTEIARNLHILENAFQLYETGERPDLAVKLRMFQGRYLEAVGRREDALKLYVMASEKYVRDHFGFVALFDRAVQIMEEDKRKEMRRKYVQIVAENVPEYQSDFNRRFDLKNPVFVHVAKAYVGVLRGEKDDLEAERWEERLKKRQKAP